MNIQFPIVVPQRYHIEAWKRIYCGINDSIYHELCTRNADVVERGDRFTDEEVELRTQFMINIVRVCKFRIVLFVVDN